MTRRIAILDAMPASGLSLKVRLAAARYNVSLHRTGLELIRHVIEGSCDLALVTLGQGAEGEVIRRLRSMPSGARLPIIALYHAEGGEVAALRAGADAALPHLGDEGLLQAHIRSLLHAEATHRDLEGPPEIHGFFEMPQAFDTRARLAMVCASPEQAWSWQRRIRPFLKAEIAITPWQEALDGAGPEADGYLIAEHLPGYGCGQMLLTNIRARPARHEAPVALVLGPNTPAHQASALDLGASIVLPEGFDGEVGGLRLQRLLARKLQRDHLRQGMQEGLRLAVQDPLTGLHNRRYALPALRRMIATNSCGAVMVIDLDHFKSVNDRFGHPAGDRVLVEMARRLKQNLPEGGLLARYGGEEFLLALPRLSPATLRGFADHLREALSAEAILLPGDELALRVTASIGVALPQASDSADCLIEAADHALLSAKSAGRDRVSLARTTAA